MFFELFIAEYAHELNCKLVLMANFTSQGRRHDERIVTLALISCFKYACLIIASIETIVIETKVRP